MCVCVSHTPTHDPNFFEQEGGCDFKPLACTPPREDCVDICVDTFRLENGTTIATRLFFEPNIRRAASLYAIMSVACGVVSGGLVIMFVSFSYNTYFRRAEAIRTMKVPPPPFFVFSTRPNDKTTKK